MGFSIVKPNNNKKKKNCLYFEVTMSPIHSGLMYKLVHKTRISTRTIDTPLLVYMITLFL